MSQRRSGHVFLSLIACVTMGIQIHAACVPAQPTEGEDCDTSCTFPGGAPGEKWAWDCPFTTTLCCAEGQRGYFLCVLNVRQGLCCSGGAGVDGNGNLCCIHYTNPGCNP